MFVFAIYETVYNYVNLGKPFISAIFTPYHIPYHANVKRIRFLKNQIFLRLSHINEIEIRCIS